ncbi:Uncharacterised protein [Chlamydia trachomatis]|nr:Uncharacterised protein [Chlamydia trachomatis]
MDCEHPRAGAKGSKPAHHAGHQESTRFQHTRFPQASEADARQRQKAKKATIQARPSPKTPNPRHPNPQNPLNGVLSDFQGRYLAQILPRPCSRVLGAFQSVCEGSGDYRWGRELDLEPLPRPQRQRDPPCSTPGRWWRAKRRHLRPKRRSHLRASPTHHHDYRVTAFRVILLGGFGWLVVLYYGSKPYKDATGHLCPLATGHLCPVAKQFCSQPDNLSPCLFYAENPPPHRLLENYPLGSYPQVSEANFRNRTICPLALFATNNPCQHLAGKQ